MYWLLGRKSNLSTNNKLLIYKVILKPTWTYGTKMCWLLGHKSKLSTNNKLLIYKVIPKPTWTYDKLDKRTSDVGVPICIGTITAVPWLRQLVAGSTAAALVLSEVR
jgi:hypothetical protein